MIVSIYLNLQNWANVRYWVVCRQSAFISNMGLADGLLLVNAPN